MGFYQIANLVTEYTPRYERLERQSMQYRTVQRNPKIRIHIPE